MSFRSLARDLRDSIGSLSRRSFDLRLNGQNHAKSRSAVHELHDKTEVVQSSCWANLPPELLWDVIKRLEESEAAWPARKHVVACSAVCRSWREMCREIVQSPEFCGKLTFPLSLKQPGPRDGTIQCFIRRNKSKLTYRLFLSLSPSLVVESGKFLLSAKRNRRTTSTEYVISMESDNISRSSRSYIGKVRSNFLGTKFIIYDAQKPPNSTTTDRQPGSTSWRFNSKKVSPNPPTENYNVAQVSYELNVLGTRGPRKMQCVMHTVPASSLEPGGTVPGQPPELTTRPLEDSFRSVSSSSFKPVVDHSSEFTSARFSDIINLHDDDVADKERPLVLKNKPPRWHEQLQCWCLNFRGRVTVASVKNFQLIASNPLPNNAAAGGPTPAQPGASNNPQQQQPSSDPDKILLQFGKVGKDMFTMDYRYPLSAFQAFAICLTSFDTKLACE